MSTERMVVVGADAGGMSAAAQARRRRDRRQLDIVVFDRGHYTSWSACGLPYLVGDLVHDPEDLIARTPEQFRASGIEVALEHDVVGIDVAARTLNVRGPDGLRTEPFDQLVIATGSIPVRPDLPGAHAAGIHGIQTIGDGIALRADVDAGARKAVVVGGGYIGLEMAEALHRRGLEVCVVERSAQPMNTLDPDMGALVADTIRGLGIELHSGVPVESFATGPDGRVTAVRTSDGVVDADIVVLGLGVRPASELAAEAGIEVGATGGIVTDARMATSADGIWAAGDCAEIFHRVSRRPVAIALGTHANKEGRVVGVNATGGSLTFPGVIGTAVTKLCDYEIGRTGLSEREAADAGFAHVSAKIEATSRAGYYPGSSAITVKLVAEVGTGRLLGAQVIGREGAAKRVDVLAAAIWNEMTADEFSQIDLGYAPPFAPVWDPVLVAARQLTNQINQSRGSSG
jgi:NADPH-dependent 2,4-dienoyl-CoA reductase/sulfur reductase-like enzyme